MILVISEHPECLYYFVRLTHTHLVTFHLDIPQGNLTDEQYPHFITLLP